MSDSNPFVWALIGGGYEVVYRTESRHVARMRVTDAMNEREALQAAEEFLRRLGYRKPQNVNQERE